MAQSLQKGRDDGKRAVEARVSTRRMNMWMALKPVLKTLGTVFVVSGTLGILQYLLGDGAVAQRMGK